MTKIRIGDFGFALAKASRENRDAKWLKRQLDVLFTKFREQRQNNKRMVNGGKKQNSRHFVPANA